MSIEQRIEEIETIALEHARLVEAMNGTSQYTRGKSTELAGFQPIIDEITEGIPKALKLRYQLGIPSTEDRESFLRLMGANRGSVMDYMQKEEHLRYLHERFNELHSEWMTHLSNYASTLIKFEGPIEDARKRACYDFQLVTLPDFPTIKIPTKNFAEKLKTQGLQDFNKVFFCFMGITPDLFAQRVIGIVETTPILTKARWGRSTQIGYEGRPIAYQSPQKSGTPST